MVLLLMRLLPFREFAYALASVVTKTKMSAVSNTPKRRNFSRLENSASLWRLPLRTKVRLDPFRIAAPFGGKLGANYLEFEWFVPRTGLQFFNGCTFATFCVFYSKNVASFFKAARPEERTHVLVKVATQ